MSLSSKTLTWNFELIEIIFKGYWYISKKFHIVGISMVKNRDLVLSLPERKFPFDPLDGDNKYTANDICKMIEFLLDNIYVRFGGQLFQQMVGIPIGTNCAPLLADLFLYFYENEF